MGSGCFQGHFWVIYFARVLPRISGSDPAKPGHLAGMLTGTAAGLEINHCPVARGNQTALWGKHGPLTTCPVGQALIFNYQSNAN